MVDRKTPGAPVTGQISVDTLDLAWLAESIVGPVEDSVSGDLSNVPVVQPAWTGLDVTLDIAAKQFWPDIFAPMQNFAGKLVWKGDQVEIAEAAGDWLGGKVEGRILLGNGDGSGFFQTRLNLKGGDLASIAWSNAGCACCRRQVRPVAGPGSVRQDDQGHGRIGQRIGHGDDQ